MFFKLCKLFWAYQTYWAKTMFHPKFLMESHLLSKKPQKKNYHISRNVSFETVHEDYKLGKTLIQIVKQLSFSR